MHSVVSLKIQHNKSHSVYANIQITHRILTHPNHKFRHMKLSSLKLFRWNIDDWVESIELFFLLFIAKIKLHRKSLSRCHDDRSNDSKDEENKVKPQTQRKNKLQRIESKWHTKLRRFPNFLFVSRKLSKNEKQECSCSAE